MSHIFDEIQVLNVNGLIEAKTLSKELNGLLGCHLGSHHLCWIPRTYVKKDKDDDGNAKEDDYTLKQPFENIWGHYETKE